MQFQGSFNVHDAGLHIMREPDAESDVSLRCLRALLGVLYRNGWKITPDPHVEKNYACLGKYRRYGRRGNLELKASASGRSVEIRFFQNVANVENPNGGEFDFDKLRKMPYLLRLRTQFELDALSQKAIALGFVDRREPRAKDAREAVERHRLETAKIHPKAYDGPMPYCQGDKDSDGSPLKNGDFRTCYHYAGHVMQGTIYYSLNNMWYFVVNNSEYHQIAAWELFTFDPAKHPRRRRRNPESSLERDLRRSVESADFARAGKIHAAMQRAGFARALSLQISKTTK